ncbi:MAG: magnesium/cobalt transporter CorA [Isosphaeraceae bacterium]
MNRSSSDLLPLGRPAGPPSSMPATSGAAPDAAAYVERALISLLYRDKTGKLHPDWPLDRIAEALADAEGLLWLDLQAEEDAAVHEVEAVLRDVFGFHPLAVEDALQEANVPKVDDWGDYLYLVFRLPHIEGDSDELTLQEFDAFLGPNYLVTYHVAPLEVLAAERDSIARDPRDRLHEGADYLLFRVLEKAVDSSLAAIERLDERVDAIQDIVIEHPSPKVVRRIFRIKRSAIRLHKTLGPQREVLNRLARDDYRAVRPQHRVYFRDLYDHLVRIHDISESLRDLIAGTLETYLSVISNRTNDIMKTLTMVSVMFLPMSFLAGFFGMNFFGEPLALRIPLPRGLLFVATCVMMAISPCFMWIYAKRRKWF